MDYFHTQECPFSSVVVLGGVVRPLILATISLKENMRGKSKKAFEGQKFPQTLFDT